MCGVRLGKKPNLLFSEYLTKPRSLVRFCTTGKYTKRLSIDTTPHIITTTINSCLINIKGIDSQNKHFSYISQASPTQRVLICKSIKIKGLESSHNE